MQQQAEANSPTSQNRYLLANTMTKGGMSTTMGAPTGGGNAAIAGLNLPTMSGGSAMVNGPNNAAAGLVLGSKSTPLTNDDDHLDMSNHNVPLSLLRAPKFSNNDGSGENRDFLSNKAYFIITLLMGIFYFIDVFVGMFLL